jgi:hypothetical protein
VVNADGRHGQGADGGCEDFALDEPTAGLSPKYRGEIFGTIQKIKGTGVPILIVEQNAKQALGVSDRGYAVGRRGQGTPASGWSCGGPRNRAHVLGGDTDMWTFGFEFVNFT